VSGYAKSAAASGCALARRRPGPLAHSFHPRECAFCVIPLEELEGKVRAANGHPAYEAARNAFDRLPDEVKRRLVAEAQGYVEVGHE